MPVLDARVEGLIDAAAALDTAQWTAAMAAESQDLAFTVEARRSVKPSAAVWSSVEKAVRDALRPHAEKIKAAKSTGFINATTMVKMAALAILLRDKLTSAEYDALMAPLVAGGIDRGILYPDA